MKVTAGRVRSFLAAPDKALVAILIYGPDAGLAAERIAALTRTVVPDPADPFRVARIASVALASDPARLADEAAAIAFGGGRRVVLVEDADGDALPALRGFLAAPMGDALVLVQAGALRKGAPLLALFEGADNAAALSCFPDDEEALAAVIRDTLGRHGIAADGDALAWLSTHLGGDRLATRSELEKLALYLGRPGRLKLDDVLASVGDGAALTLDDLALAAADGDQEEAQRALDRVLAEGVHPVQLLRALARHFKRLHLLAGLVGSGMPPKEAVDSLKPKLHFRMADRLRAQTSRWSAARAASALDLLQQAEIDVKTTGMPTASICGRAVLQIARAASRAK